MVEPAACAVHAALRRAIAAGDTVVVIGAGTLGLSTVAALAPLVRPDDACTVLVGAKHSHQRRLAEQLGADAVVPPDELPGPSAGESGSLVLAGRLTGGADVVFDCVGSRRSLTQALAMVRPRGRSCWSGCRARSRSTWPPCGTGRSAGGAYAYGTETASPTRGTPTAAPSSWPSTRRRRRLGSARLGHLPPRALQEAVAHAAAAGRRGAVKVAFDLRNRKGRTR